MTVDAPAAPAKAPMALHVSLWIAQVLLGAGFMMFGGMKLAMNYADMVKMATEAHSIVIPEALLRFIGVSEVAGGLGMLLPAGTRVMPILTPWAGVGLATIMVLASALHISQGEWSHLGMTLPLLAMAAVVAWGRFKAEPIVPRG